MNRIRILKKPIIAATTAIMAVTISWSSQAAFAQGGQPVAASAGVQAFNACATVNYSDSAAKALGVTAAELRKAIVNGQTLQDIASSKNIDIATVTTAIETTRKAAIAQAVSDGLLTQEEATQLQARIAGGPQTNSRPQGNNAAQGGPQGGPQGNGASQGNNGSQGTGAPQGNPQRPNPQRGVRAILPDIGILRLLLQVNGTGGAGPRRGFGGGEMFNVVKPYAVASLALNLSCADLVKSLVTASGKSIAAVASDQKVDISTISGALTKAYQAALAQDVTDGIITQEQANQVSANLSNAVSEFLNNTNIMRRGQFPPQGQ